MLTVIIINYPTLLPSLWPCLFCSSLNHTVLLSIARTSDHTHTTYVGPLSSAGKEIPGPTPGTEPGVHMLVLCSTTDPTCQSLGSFLINGSITVSKSDTPVQIPTCYKPADWPWVSSFQMWKLGRAHEMIALGTEQSQRPGQMKRVASSVRLSRKYSAGPVSPWR